MFSQEIITFQVGNYSNYVGTHYWNLQRKHVSHNIENDNYQTTKLFRESNSGKSSRYVPRLISFDHKHSLKALKVDGSFQELQTEDTSPSETTQHVLYAQDRIARNELSRDDVYSCDVSHEDAESRVTTWSDFMTQQLDENTIQLLTQGYDDGTEFTGFGLGIQEYNSMFDDIEDKLHYWVEECHTIEGFQILTDIHDGFCGISSKLVESLRDEYTQKCILPYMNWPVFRKDDNRSIYHDINIALTFQAFKENASLFVLQSLQTDLFDRNSESLHLPFLNYKKESLYQTSAVLASSFNSTTLPWRRNNRDVTMSDLCHHISQNKWKLSGTSFGLLYLDPEGNTTLFDMLLHSKLYGSHLHSLFSGLLVDERFYPTTHAITVQNVPEHLVIPKHMSSDILQSLHLNRNVFTNDPLSVVEFFNNYYYPCGKTASQFYYSSYEFDTVFPFSSTTSSSKIDIQNDLTVLSTLFTSPNFYDLLHELTTRVHQVNLHKYHCLEEFGLDHDLINELVEDLTNLCKEYNSERAFDELDI